MLHETVHSPRFSHTGGGVSYAFKTREAVNSLGKTETDNERLRDGPLLKDPKKGRAMIPGEY